MYQDAREELQRLQEALLEEEAKSGDTAPSQWDLEEALSDIPDIPKPPKRRSVTGQMILIPAITAVLTAALVVGILYAMGWIG